MDNIIKYILLFFFYSAGGWCLESLYCSIGEKRFVNRGFLTGPMCPIYGTAAIVLTIFIYNPFKERPLIVFLLGMVLCDIVEYITSFLMEKLFNARWWDYTYEFCNIKGRICLKHTLYWGIISVIFVKVIHPSIDGLYEKINKDYLVYILSGILIVFVLDLINAVRKALDIRKLTVKLNALQKAINEIYLNAKSAVEDSQKFKDFIEKSTGKANELRYAIEDIYYEFEQKLSRVKPLNNEGKTEEKRAVLPNRLMYNNPHFAMLIKGRLQKFKDYIEDVKAIVSDMTIK